MVYLICWEFINLHLINQAFSKQMHYRSNFLSITNAFPDAQKILKEKEPFMQKQMTTRECSSLRP